MPAPDFLLPAFGVTREKDAHLRSLHPLGRKTSGKDLVTHVEPQDHAFLTPVKKHVKSVEYLKPRNVSYPWTGETHFRVTPAACGNSVFRTTARILVPVSDMSPMAIADSGASHVILPQSALYDSKSVNLRLSRRNTSSRSAQGDLC